jgi:hypothetical protein
MADERVRLLFCSNCRTVQAVPEFHGPVEYDDTLNNRLGEHLFADGRSHELVVGDIEKDQWDKKSVQDKIIFKMAQEQGFVPPGTGDGIGPTFYAVKATYEEDAIMCWKRHRRVIDCGDYKTQKMKILPDTKGDRKELGLAPTRPGTYLCQFCPVQSIIDQKQRAAAGSYENPYR